MLILSIDYLRSSPDKLLVCFVCLTSALTRGLHGISFLSQTSEARSPKSLPRRISLRPQMKRVGNSIDFSLLSYMTSVDLEVPQLYSIHMLSVLASKIGRLLTCEAPASNPDLEQII